MRIISDKRDYYDSCQQYGDGTTFLRKSITENLDRLPVHLFQINPPKINVNQVVIGFCGKIYNYFSVSAPNEDYFAPAHHYGIYDLSKLSAIIDKHCKKDDLDIWYNRSRRRFHGYSTIKSIERQLTENATKDFNAAAFKYFEKAPIFTIEPHSRSGGELTYNSSELKRFEFYKVFPHYQAYQELQMWVYNQAAPEKPIPQNLNDEEMAFIKGFDRFSFRKDKTTKKR